MRQTGYLLLCVLLLSSCYSTRRSRGGGQISRIPGRVIHTEDIALPPGYKIEAVATGLTFPSSCTLDGEGKLCVLTTGYSYGEVFKEPMLVRVNGDGTATTIAAGTKNGPWTCVLWWEGNFYVSEGGEMEGGKILRISPDGEITTLVSGLPSMGDHHTDCIVIKDNYIYFGQGTATNSAVVGPDNAEYGWLKRKPGFHDVPCKDITLAGKNYTSENVLDPSKGQATTGAYLPFGTPSTPGQVIRGRLPCNGAVMRIPLTGGQPELVAWGLRNPYGLALAPGGKIYITENGYDDRGNRPVWGAGDVLWELQQDAWYGFPDYSGGSLMEGKKEFMPKGERVSSLLKTQPGKVPRPAAVLGVHASANGFDFSSNPAFGHVGEAFIAEFGDMAPKVGKVMNPVGFKVVRVDVNSGVIEDFATNRTRKNGPASKDGNGGLERPLSVRFNASGTELYVVDFGIIKVSKEGVMPMEGMGVVWRITKK